ncbi:hypothetical protein TSUD_331480 [Trifolium subterraneum]|uniref:Uncharacterized protein n=1 Tax=Trifolium subterraneum TaxID=3900 RepID=A0A2Z6MJB2_TRISU|nr:hypothetical protein TSUD_331480 [Trifolium subterraneum]
MQLIKLRDGVTLEGVTPIRQVVVSHFAFHFKATNMDRHGVDNLFFKNLNPLESSSLTKPFSEVEVKPIVWDCDNYKSPGPDGINFGFIKDFWPEIQKDVLRFVLEFHQNDKLNKGLNFTVIALIPKVDSPLNDFRPISLVGCLYKILILDKGRMSFPNLWRKLIKECVGTTTTSVLVNGSPTKEFPLERGLRQGDPLSPFLLLLAAEGLNVLMKTMVERNLFTGWGNVCAMRAVLVLFENMPGLKVNFNKSMLVGVNIPDSCLRKKYGGLGVRQLREFNLVLLGKWCWRMLVDIVGLRGAWFGEHISKKVGDESNTLFLTDPWVDGTSLSERFGRLFDLAETQLCSVTKMALLGWGAGGAVWQRQLRGWEEEMLRECQTLLLNISLQVSILVWRLLRDSLPTKANLVTRDILSSEAHYCVSECGAVESAQQLILSCSTFGSLWPLVSSWIGSSLVDSHSILDHFVQFTHSAGGPTTRCSFMQLTDLLAIGLCGTSETLNCSEARHIHYSICWTRSSLFPIGG